MSQSPLDQLFPFDSGNPIFPALRQLMLVLENRLQANEVARQGYESALKSLQERGLQAIAELIEPLYEQGKLLSSQGAVLNAHSPSNLSLGSGLQTFTLDEGVRIPFVFSPWMAAISEDGSAVMAGKFLAYFRDQGVLNLQIYETFGDLGVKHAGWNLAPTVQPLLSAPIVDGGYFGSPPYTGADPPYTYTPSASLDGGTY